MFQNSSYILKSTIHIAQKSKVCFFFHLTPNALTQSTFTLICVPNATDYNKMGSNDHHHQYRHDREIQNFRRASVNSVHLDEQERQL